MELNEGFEVIQPYKPKKEKFTIYFIETHLSSEDNTIEVILDPSESCFENLSKIDTIKKYYGKDVFLVNIYKCGFNPLSIDKKKINFSKDSNTIEIKITLNQKKCVFDSINTIDIEKNNFLGLLKFSEYKWYLGMKYQPPKTIEISNAQILKYFINALLDKDNKNRNDACFIELMKYGINLLRNSFNNNYDYELFIQIYINSFYTDNGQLIKDALDLFEIDKALINNNIFIEDYLEEIEKIYNNHNEHLEKTEIFTEEKYLIIFYTVNIYFLSKLKQNETLLIILYELMNNNKYDKLILPKLYLSNFFSFYKTLTIPEDIKAILENTFIISSKTIDELINAFSLISEFTNKSFLSILMSIKNNYEKIHEICSKENEYIEIDDYYKQDEKDINESTNIKDYLDLILTNKKKYNYECIKINKKTYLYFISNNYSKQFLDFFENKLFDYFLKYDDLETALSFSSQLRKREFVPLLKNIKKNIDKIINICSKSKKYIDIQNYMQRRGSDNLKLIKQLIEYIIQSEKSASYTFITFSINIWAQYTKIKDLDDLFTLRKIIFLCKEIEPELDESNINLGEAIHNLGLELIRQGKIKGEKLTDFLAENEIFYTDYKIKTLEYENNELKTKVDNIKRNVNKLQSELDDVKSEVKSLSEENRKIWDKIDSMESSIRDIKNDVNYLKTSTITTD